MISLSITVDCDEDAVVRPCHGLRGAASITADVTLIMVLYPVRPESTRETLADDDKTCSGVGEIFQREVLLLSVFRAIKDKYKLETAER